MFRIVLLGLALMIVSASCSRDVVAPDPSSLAYIRVLNFGPSAVPMSAYFERPNRLSWLLLDNNIGFGEFSDYVAVAAGEHKIRFFPTGVDPAGHASFTYFYEPGTVSTLSVEMVGDSPEDAYWSSLSFVDDEAEYDPDHAQVGFINALLDAPEADIIRPSGEIVVKEFGYDDYTAEYPVGSGADALRVVDVATGVARLNTEDLDLVRGKLYTVVVTGLLANGLYDYTIAEDLESR